MRLPVLIIPDDAYELAWKNRKQGETIAEVLTWCVHFALDPELPKVIRRPIPSKPLLSYVEVIP